MYKLLFFVFFISTTCLTAQNEKLVWHQNIEETVQKASVSGKKTLVYFSGSDWCKPCKELKNKVFNSSIFKQKATKYFELVNIDFVLNRKQLPKKELKYIEQSAEKYNKKGIFPLVLILNDKGEVLTSINGYKGESAERYVEYLSGN